MSHDDDDRPSDRSGADPSARLREISESLGIEIPTASSNAAAASNEPTSGIDAALDILSDESWEWLAQDDDALGDEARRRVWERFDAVDVVGWAERSISAMFQQPTMDFEVQYLQGHAVIREAWWQLDAERRRSEQPEWSQIADVLAQRIDRERARLQAFSDEHTRRHQAYNQAMVPVRQRIRTDHQRHVQEMDRLNRRTNEEILRMDADGLRERQRSFDRMNEQWLRNHLR